MKKNKLIPAVIGVLLLTAVAAGGYLIFNANYVKIGEKYYSRSVETLELSNTGVEDISVIDGMEKLESADFSGCPVTSLPALPGCGSLLSLYVSGSDFSAEECLSFYEAHPSTELVCGVRIGGGSFSSQAKTVELPDGMSDVEIRRLAALRQLQSVDLLGSEVSDETYDYLLSVLPDCQIARRFTFNGEEHLSTDKSVKLSQDFFDSADAQETERLRYFARLETIDATDCPDSDALVQLQESYPEVLVKWNTTIFGKQVSTAAKSLNLNKKTYSLEDFIAEFDAKLGRFRNLKRIYMKGCRLNNDSMDKLIERYPDIKFVWNISFMGYNMSTDAVSFSTLIRTKAEGRKLNETNMAPLFKYCTELVSIDIGYCHFSDLTCLENLQELRAIILTDNFVTDITPLSKLSKLEFLEMNDNQIESVEPLRDLRNLKMVNIYRSRKATDLSPLYDHPSLEIAIFDKSVPEEEQNRFTESNPDCQTFFTVDSDEFKTTNEAWRSAPLREKFKDSFRRWKNVTGFDEKTETFTYNF